MSTTATEYTIDADGVFVGEVHITAPELRDGGWILDDEAEDHCDRDHCADGDCGPCEYCADTEPASETYQVLKRWHDEDSEHSGAFRFCYTEPCKSVSEALGA